jgi:hypothetical protein
MCLCLSAQVLAASVPAASTTGLGIIHWLSSFPWISDPHGFQAIAPQISKISADLDHLSRVVRLFLAIGSGKLSSLLFHLPPFVKIGIGAQLKANREAFSGACQQDGIMFLLLPPTVHCNPMWN